mmetsp:Transcript_136501/g.236846  ORF Transcript_136501/g.236846 Transcript_136501/m.236846 type:complete len:220 (+) Transcript_136501:965-1624(+)
MTTLTSTIGMLSMHRPTYSPMLRMKREPHVTRYMRMIMNQNFKVKGCRRLSSSVTARNTNWNCTYQRYSLSAKVPSWSMWYLYLPHFSDRSTRTFSCAVFSLLNFRSSSSSSSFSAPTLGTANGSALWAAFAASSTWRTSCGTHIRAPPGPCLRPITEADETADPRRLLTCSEPPTLPTSRAASSALASSSESLSDSSLSKWETSRPLLLPSDSVSDSK